MDGALGCDAVAGEAVGERCNGLDDDCDGMSDEDFAGLGAMCASGVGACARDGVGVCVDGALGCDAVAGAAMDELCNEVDDDCDGRVDEIAACREPVCGDGFVDPGEQCDGGEVCRGCQWAAVDERERNETVATASEAGVFRRLRGVTGREGVGCCARPDTDIFRITIEEPVSFGAYCRSGIGCLGWQSPYTCSSVALLDEGGGVVASNAGSHPELRCAYVDAGVAPALGRVESGTYYVRVIHRYVPAPVDPPPGNYVIELEYGPPAE
ncbi:MAG: MopE-related protein [bacterium]